MATIDFSDSNLIGRQENEVIVLKSMFGNNCYDLREVEEQQQQQQTKKGKKTAKDNNDERKLPVLRITLFPLNSQSQCGNTIYVQIDLKVEFTNEYPNKIPKLTLENDRGLSNDLKKNLLELLIKKAKSLIGREMIYELCHDVQEFLYLNNNPPAKSFYEQMLDNRRQRDNAIDDDDEDEFLFSYETERNKFEEDHIEEINEAVLTKRELLRAEMKQKRKFEKRERLSSSTNSPSSHPKSGNSESDAREDEILGQTNFKPFIIEFNEPNINKCKINCIKLIKQIKQYNFKIYRGIDLNTNEICLVYEWILVLEKNQIYEPKRLDLCLNEFKKIEDELRKLIKISSPLVSKYLAYKSYKRSDKPYFIIQLCLSYIEGNTLEIFLNKKTALQYSNLQLYTNELLKILDFLHSNHISHRDLKVYLILPILFGEKANKVLYFCVSLLKASCVYLDSSGSLKLTDYSIVKRINNLYELVVNNAQNTLITNNRTDVHQLGIMLLSLATGEIIQDYFPKLPTNLFTDFRNFISRCIYDQADVKTLLTHSFITKPIDDKIANTAINKPSIFSHIGNNAGVTVGAATGGDYIREAANSIHNSIYNASAIIPHAMVNDKTPFLTINEIYKPDDAIRVTEDDDENILETFTDYPMHTRLNTEFNVLGKVGSGAFGEVLKVQNKIDMCMYAIKRICLNPNSTQLNKQIQREIKLLSRLNHENVVRYYSTWFEKYETELDDSESTEVTTSQTATTATTATTTTNKLVDKQPVIKQQKNKQQNNKNKNKIIAKSSSFSDLILNQANMNFPINDDFSDNNNDDDDDDFSMEFPNVNKDKVTLSSSSSSSSSSASSSSSSSSSSSDSDETESSLSDSDSDDLKIVKVKNNKKKVQFGLSPAEAKLLDKERDNYFKIKDQLSDSIVFVCEGENEKSKNNKDNNEETGTDKSEKPVINKRLKAYVYIQMEYCKGRTLKDLIDKGLYKTVDKVWILFREILQGLNHIHKLGMIHRDLKPRNVLINAEGHAKIGDFGLATKNFNAHHPNQQDIINDSLINNTSNQLNNNDSNHFDSISLSGNVGTALYVAPELLTPSGINKYSYTQKVDIYSLGIMFYEMCFPFSTGMERVHTLNNLRKRQFKYPDIDKKPYANQIVLIESMLEHNPDSRPSAKDLLDSDKVPRKANEIALDQLLKDSLKTRNTNNYLKIFNAVFDQKVSFKDDVPYDDHNIKAPTLKYLQIREYVQNTLTRLFQKNGAFMIAYPLLIPSNEICKDYNNSFQVVDSSGLLLTLPYNHRLHFARYIARSGLNDIKRFYIGNVYQVYSEKLRFIGNHPLENTEASFDIVTSTNADYLPEIEILWLLNDIISSFNELADYEFKLVINHSLLLNSIILYAGIRQEDLKTQKDIYTLLVTYNKLFKANEVNQDSNKEDRSNWLKEKLAGLGFNENVTNRLVNFFIKHGTVDKVLSEMKNLTKSETHLARLAKQAINQIKTLTQCLNIFDLKYEISVSTSFVLPSIANPFEYNGLIYALYQRKKKKSEYEIIASGGRYDRLVNYFCFKKDQRKQYAIGVSIDFERLVAIIHEKAIKLQKTQQTVPPTQQQSSQLSIAPYSQLQQTSPINNVYKNQLAIFSYGLNIQSTILSPQASSTTNQKTTNEQQQLQVLSQIDIKNRLNLFKHIYYAFKTTPICTPLIHEKFIDISEMDNYCKRNSILNYIYLNNSETQAIQQVSKIFQKYQLKKSNSSVDNNLTLSHTNDDDFNLNNVEFYVRSLNNSKANLKFVEKKYKLNDFLFNLNKLSTDTCTPLISISSIINTHLSIPQSTNQTNSSNALSSLNNLTTGQFITQYLDSIMNISSTPPTIMYQQQQTQQQQQQQQQQQTNVTQQTQNILAQLNITVLIEQNSRSSSSSSSGINANLNGTNSGNINNLTSSNSSLNNLSLNARNANVGIKKIESNLITRLTHIFQLFSTRTRIELIAIEISDSVLQQLSSTIRLDCDEHQFSICWKEFLDKLNPRNRKQIVNFKFEEILRDLRYRGRSKVFIIYSLKSEGYKIFVIP